MSWQAWYLDDGVLTDSIENLLKALQFLQSRFSALNLAVNITKCRIWSPCSTIPEDLPVTAVEWDSEKVVLWIPFGTRAAVRCSLETV